MIDQRGTGKSGALDCLSLQHSPVRTPRDIGDCGKHLGDAADLYGTRLAAQDMAAVLDALNIQTIDYYGDSYGTFFGQVFSALYPNRIRSMVLDGAYPVIGETPWYSNSAAVVRKSFNESRSARTVLRELERHLSRPHSQTARCRAQGADQWPGTGQ